MKLDKKKIIFSGVIVLTLTSMIGYYYLVLGNDGNKNNELQQTVVPKLKEEQRTFSSKKEAVDALEEKRERNAPSPYDERFLDDEGQYDPDLLDNKKQRMVDSIYRLGRINYSDSSYHGKLKRPLKKTLVKKGDSSKKEKDTLNELKSMALEQQLFFDVSLGVQAAGTHILLEVEVNGDQTIKVNDRLQMHTTEDAIINGRQIPKNTIVYAIVKFRPNRVLLEVENIDHKPLKLQAFDQADGLEGIYIKNSFRGDVFQEVLGDVVEDINIPGVPKVSSIKKVFQRNNRNVKVTVNNNYKLLLVSKSQSIFDIKN